jgi:hypothetical protein
VASSDGTRRLLFRPDGKGGGRIDLTGRRVSFTPAALPQQESFN